MLSVIISPAKQMRLATDTFAPRGVPPFPAKTARLYEELRRMERDEGPGALQALWRVSDKLLAEALDTLHRFVPVVDAGALDDPRIARAVAPALFSYVGIQYRSMAPEVLDGDALAWLQEHLWIVSGWYGCVRPFDAVEPYRLEMGARLSVDGARDLYGFWSADIARAVAGGDPAAARVVNLASVEYARAVLPWLVGGTSIVTCIFCESLRDGKPVQRATASKIARGSMVRWMAEHGIDDPRELERFDVGYRLDAALSHEQTTRSGAHERTLVFMRA